MNQWFIFSMLGHKQNGCHFEDNIFKGNFLYENHCISIQISLNFVPRDPISNGFAPNRWQAIIWNNEA